MTTKADIPVKRDGKTFRLIMNGDKAGLFDKNGLAERLIVTDNSDRRKLPAVTTPSGHNVKLVKTSRPCSCKGAPWKTGISKLLEQL